MHVRRVPVAAWHSGVHGSFLPLPDHGSVLHLFLDGAGRGCRITGTSRWSHIRYILYYDGSGEKVLPHSLLIRYSKTDPCIMS